jgi:hypothetical protein
MNFNYMHNVVSVLWLPPFAANQMLANDEIIDILLFATPNSWQVEMEKQNWDPMESSASEALQRLITFVVKQNYGLIAVSP